MLKKILIVLAILAVGIVSSVNLFSKKAPEFLRSAIERALNKKVIIQSIGYHFPGTFELEGFEVKESEPFSGETSFYVDHIRLSVSPMSFSQKKLIIDSIDVENAGIFVRKYRGHLVHALSNAMKRNPADASETAVNDSGNTVRTALPLEIHEFNVNKSNFRFIDYDVDANGFVIALDAISAKVKNVHFPLSANKTFYDVTARLPQGRDQQPAVIQISGWTAFSSKDTDAHVMIQRIFLPYFRPYYAQVTQASIESGYLDTRMGLRIENSDLAMNADLEIAELLFGNYELDNQLFGLNAEEILSFLKDQSGRLKLQITARWNLADRNVRAKDVIRQSIERSLKNTVLGNVGNILGNVIQRLGKFKQILNN